MQYLCKRPNVIYRYNNWINWEIRNSMEPFGISPRDGYWNRIIFILPIVLLFPINETNNTGRYTNRCSECYFSCCWHILWALNQFNGKDLTLFLSMNFHLLSEELFYSIFLEMKCFDASELRLWETLTAFWHFVMLIFSSSPFEISYWCHNAIQYEQITKQKLCFVQYQVIQMK